MSGGKSVKTHKLVHDKTGNIINVGDVALDFRGNAHIVQGWTSGEDWSRNNGEGRVHTESGTFYPSVIDCTIMRNDEPTAEQVRAARYVQAQDFYAGKPGSDYRNSEEHLASVSKITEIPTDKLYALAHGDDMVLTIEESRTIINKVIIPSQE